MTLREIYETGLKDKELATLLYENGWTIIDFLNWIEFQRANGNV